jgi:hypothetical protein
MQCQIELRGTDNVTVDAVADVVQFSSFKRTLRGGGFLVGAFVLGVGSIFVPLWHFIGTWAFPLMGILVGRMLFQVRGKVLAVRGQCTDCDNEISLQNVGVLDNEALWIRCPSCTKPWEVRV